jgi:hypothetical protein
MYMKNYRVFGLCPLSGILKTEEQKLVLFSSSGEEEIPTLLGPLEKLISITGPLELICSPDLTMTLLSVMDDFNKNRCYRHITLSRSLCKEVF